MKHSLSRLLKVGALLLPLVGAACSTAFNPQQLTATVAVDTPAGPVELATATLLPDPELTAALMCTPPACAPGEGYACPAGNCPGGCGTVCLAPTPVTGPLAAAPTDWENLESWLATLWRSNMNPAAVRAALQQSGVQRDLGDWAAADFDGDLQDEWVLVLYDQSLPGVPFGAAGDLWVVNGDGVIFRYYAAPSNDIYEFLAPSIVALADMTGDGVPELIANAPLCGAHTCYDNYRIIGRRDGQLTDLAQAAPVVEGALPGTVISLSYADTRLDDVDGDGLTEFLVHGGTIGSAGAGIVRPWTEVWGWDGAAVTRDSIILDPAQYRHHVLYEANDLMAAGELGGALALYEAAINEGGLRDDGFAYPPEQTRADINSFAAFRLILIDLLQNNVERANSRLAWLQSTYPQSAAAGAAVTLVGGWSGPENAGALCAQIESNLAALENPSGALADMGYGNPSLGAADFCP
ncbi:MAG: hypothetical protein KA170_04870 [Candidatus Promineofilum sp.]|nr:hypothetical protein [Promineifilum sp.]